MSKTKKTDEVFDAKEEKAKKAAEITDEEFHKFVAEHNARVEKHIADTKDINPAIHVVKYPDYRNERGEISFLLADNWLDFVGRTVREFRISLHMNSRRGRDIAKLFMLSQRFDPSSPFNFAPKVATLRIGRASMPILDMTACIYDDYIISKDIGYREGRAEYVIEVVPPLSV